MDLNLQLPDETDKFKNSLPYPISVGDMKFELIDNSSFKSHGIKRLSDDFNSRLLELKNQYIKLVEDYNKNKMVYESEFKFEPVVGKTYCLYKRQDGSTFMSMIKPTEWKVFEFVGEYMLDHNGRWIEQ